MDRFSDEPGAPVAEALYVTNFDVQSLDAQMEGIPGGEHLYGIVLESEGETQAFVISGQFAALLAARLARAAAKACDEYFATGFLVGLTESTDESRQFLSQHLGHGEEASSS